MYSLSAKKYLNAYCQPDWDNFEVVILSIAAKGREVGRTEMQDSTIWSYSTCIANMIDAMKNDAENFVLLDYEKSTISLLDTQLVNDFLSAFVRLEQSTSTKTSTTAVSGIISKELSDTFEGLGLSDAAIENWTKDYQSFSVEEKKKFEEDLSAIKPLRDALFYQLVHIGTAIGWYSPSSLIKPYSFEELTDIIKNSKDYEPLRMIRGVIEQMSGENKKEAALLAGDLLSWSKLHSQTEYAWDEVFLFTLILHLAYSAFGISVAEYRKILLENYFYRAAMLGVQVENSLAAILKETLSVFYYILTNKTFCDGLEGNIEVMVGGKKIEGKDSTLGVAIKAYLDFAGDDWTSPAKITKFVQSFLNTETAEVERKTLEHVLGIFAHLKNADLVENNIGGELSEREQYENDLLLLLSWFGLGDIGMEDLEKYFKQEKPRVPLVYFIEKIQEISDVCQEATLGDIFSLTELLHKNNWLPADQELIIFHEQDGQFHWNENLSKI